jgi:thiol-disulfide isomerase/thioredoxin
MCSFGQHLARGVHEIVSEPATASPRCAERERHFSVLHIYLASGGGECAIEIAAVYEYDSAAMAKASYLADQFATALPYDRYVKSGTDEQQRRWSQVYDAARLSEAQKQLVGGFVREMKILIFSGIWCGDCVEQCPLIYRIAQANAGKIDLRFLERPRDGELIPELRVNGGSRVPAVLFLSEDNEWCATAGDRTIHRYRAVALRKLGPLCPTGIVAPEKEELDATLGDWLNEVERVQLMLRLTPRLRQKYQD